VEINIGLLFNIFEDPDELFNLLHQIQQIIRSNFFSDRIMQLIAAKV
jgi:hypothetical protein